MFIDHSIRTECPKCGARYWVVEGQADEENPCPVDGCNFWFVPSEHRPINRQKTDRERLTDEQRERLLTVRNMVRNGLLRYGLDDVTFSWSFALEKWYGSCDFFDDGSHHIELCVPRMLEGSIDDCFETVAHELGHCISRDPTHSELWWQVAKSIGCRDASSCDSGYPLKIW